MAGGYTPRMLSLRCEVTEQGGVYEAGFSGVGMGDHQENGDGVEGIRFVSQKPGVCVLLTVP